MEGAVTELQSCVWLTIGGEGMFLLVLVIEAYSNVPFSVCSFQSLEMLKHL